MGRERHTFARAVSWLALAGSTACGMQGDLLLGGTPDFVSPARVPEEIVAAVSAGTAQDLILEFQPGTRVDEWLDRLPAGVVPKRSFTHLRMAHVQVRSLGGLTRLLDAPELIKVHENGHYRLNLAQSLPLVRQPDVASTGLRGTGVSVAVLDTGVDYTRAAFGHCTAPASAESCRVRYAQDFATADDATDENGHGTNVAAIVLGVAPDADILALDVFDGDIAYGTDILAALDWVLDHQFEYQIAAVNMSLGGGGSAEHCEDAFGTAATALREAGILTVASAGNDGYTDMLSSPACNSSVLSVGAVYDSNRGSVSFHSCSDRTTAADQVTCFSNTAPFLTLLAPGSSIYAAEIGYSGTSQAAPHVAGAVALLRSAFPEETVEITQLRLVHGGKAVVDARTGRTTPRLDVLGAVQDQGCTYRVGPALQVFDVPGGRGLVHVETGPGCTWSANSGAGWVALDATTQSRRGAGDVAFTVGTAAGDWRSAAVQVGSQSVTVQQGRTLAIQGDPSFTRSTRVTLELRRPDAAAVCVGTSSTCTSFSPLSSTVPFTLSTGDGIKKVYAVFQDASGRVVGTSSAQVTLDTRPPTDGRALLRPADGAVGFQVNSFTDALSGVARYRVVYGSARAPALAANAPATCATGLLAYDGPEAEFTHASLSNGSVYAYRVCAVDGAGNMSAGTVMTVRPASDADAPVGSVQLNGGASTTTSRVVQLRVAAQDPGGAPVRWVCVANTETCTRWDTFTTGRTWTLGEGDGDKAVRVWFADANFNRSAPVTATITLDGTAPRNGTLVANPQGTRGVQLQWTGFTDGTSGVAGYRLVYAAGTPPPDCNSGKLAYQGMETSFQHEKVTAGITYAYRVCAVDRAGNMSSGAQAKATVHVTPHS